MTEVTPVTPNPLTLPPQVFRLIKMTLGYGGSAFIDLTEVTSICRSGVFSAMMRIGGAWLDFELIAYSVTGSDMTEFMLAADAKFEELVQTWGAIRSNPVYVGTPAHETTIMLPYRGK